MSVIIDPSKAGGMAVNPSPRSGPEMDDATRAAGEVARKKAISRGISTTGEGGYSHHLLLCIGLGCCEGRDHQDTVKAVSKRLQALKTEGRHVDRSLVECLNFCRSGPLLIVYPGGTWSHSVTPAVVNRIFDEHIVGGRVVSEYAFAHNPLAAKP